MSKKKVVVALGHEALGSTIVEQLDPAGQRGRPSHPLHQQ